MSNHTIFLLLQISCKQHGINYTQVILENKRINTGFLKTIDEPEKALLSWYLFAYGNECIENSAKVKCEILNILNIDDECSKEHIIFLNEWFTNDFLVRYKLKNCPNLPEGSAIQNTIDKLVLVRKFDTISIEYHIKGLNNIQEKSWNIKRTDSYIIIEDSLKKV